MEPATFIRVPQQAETPVQEVRRARYRYRYAYARSADTRAAGLEGQDYLAIHEDGRRLAFALCDGVSQSFFGDLAARVVGDALAGWLWAEPGVAGDASPVHGALVDLLHRLVDAASAQVRRLALPAGLPPVVRDVLEQKRALGSESTFVAGLVDLAEGGIVLAWMGDSRLRLWAAGGECTATLDGGFLTRERWSSRRGPVGETHVAARSLGEVQRLVAYSDGLAQLDGVDPSALGGAALDELIAAAGASPTSDDISFLELSLSATP